MDPIAHTLVGASLAQTGLGRKTSYGGAALVIGANLPDVDGLAMLVGGDTALYWRRGWTHGLPSLVVLPLVLAGLLLVWSRLAKAETPPSLRVLMGLSYIAVWSHPTLDWLNTYGMRWLMPLDGRWFYGDTLFVVDPWFWLILSTAVFLFHSRRLGSQLLWGLFAGLAGVLMFGVVPGLRLAKTFWCASVVALILARFRRIGLEEPVSRRLARGALAVLVVYIGLMHGSSRVTEQTITKRLTDSGLEVRAIMVGAVPITPLERDVVVETPSGYLYGKAKLFPRLEMDWSPEKLPLLADSAVVRAATASPEVRGLMNWARFPYAEVEETPSGYRVYLMDARYSRSRATGLGSAEVDVPKLSVPSAIEPSAVGE